jgi:hypothetical protein
MRANTHHSLTTTTSSARHRAMPISPSRWERWMDDWAFVQVDVHDRLALPIAALTLDRAEWVKDPGLESGYDPVLDQIRYLA